MIKAEINNNIMEFKDKSEFDSYLVKHDMGVDSDGNVFIEENVGVVPKILSIWFDERIEYRKLAKKYSDEGNKEQSDFYNRRQLRQKIFLNCFSPDTNVVTPDGIRSITNFNVGDKVYSFNKTTGKTEITLVTKVYEYDYEGEMIHFLSNHVDFLTTSNHKFWVSKIGKKKYKPFGWEYSGNIIKDKVRRKFPIIAPFPCVTNNIITEIDLEKYAIKYKFNYIIKNNKIRIKRKMDNKRGRHTTYIPIKYKIEDWLELLGWFISEGSLYTSIPRIYSSGNHKGISYNIYIAQEKYQINIKSLLDRMRIPYYMNHRGFNISNDLIYKILKCECGKYSENKKIPRWVFELPISKMKCLYQSLMLGDGNLDGKRYTTKSATLKNDIIQMCFHIGENYAFLSNYDGCYRIQINPLRGIGPTLKSNHRRTIPYKGKVYCIEVEKNNVILCGRNDKYQWCGQSVYGTLGLPIFRFYDRDNAEAVTISGQEIIRSAEKVVNQMYNEKLGEKYKITYDDETSEIIYRNQKLTKSGDFVKYILDTHPEFHKK